MSSATKELRISITPQLEAFVNAKVRSGGYESASEVVREALRALKHSEEQADASLAEARAKIESAMGQARRGEVSDGDGFFDQLEAAVAPDRAKPRKRAQH